MRFPLLLLAPILLALSLHAAGTGARTPAGGRSSVSRSAGEEERTGGGEASRARARCRRRRRIPSSTIPSSRSSSAIASCPQRRPRRPRAQGSGVIVDAERGHILTNHHVIDEAQEIKVILADRRELVAELVGAPTPRPTSPCSGSTPGR